MNLFSFLAGYWNSDGRRHSGNSGSSRSSGGCGSSGSGSGCDGSGSGCDGSAVCGLGSSGVCGDEWNERCGKHSGNRGFSIIEIIIVIVIIAILASITIVSYSWMRNDALDAKTEATVSQVKKAIEIKRTKTGVLHPTGDIRTREDLLREYRMEELRDGMWVVYPGRYDISDNYGGDQGIDLKGKPFVVLKNKNEHISAGVDPNGANWITIVSYNHGRREGKIETIHGDGRHDVRTVRAEETFTIYYRVITSNNDGGYSSWDTTYFSIDDNGHLINRGAGGTGTIVPEPI